MNERVASKGTLFIQSRQVNDRVEHVVIGQEDYNDDFEGQELAISRGDAANIIKFLRQQFNLE